MKMTGEKIIKAPRQEVWDALNNAEQLEKAIPGAEKVEKVDENNLIATVKTKIGLGANLAAVTRGFPSL